MSSGVNRLGPVVVPALGLFIVFVTLLVVFALKPDPSKEPPPPGMVRIPGGTFLMGTADPMFPDAAPPHEVTLASFLMDETEVTNAQFAEFVKATGYVTTAERAIDALGPGSLGFNPPKSVASYENHLQWWGFVPKANWRQPEGPGSAIEHRQNHPVVHVSWEDATAYAAWAGKRLPTEAEWEVAARGGLSGRKYAWGDELYPGGRHMANIWQGKFPGENTVLDGHYATAPVKSYPPNGYGLYDVAGNVWEWCADWYRADAYATSPKDAPRGPESSLDPQEPGVPKRVQRGGSFLCSDLYCVRYIVAGRGKGEVTGSHAHVGFRCAK